MITRLRIVSFIIAGIGLLDSIYLSWVKLTHRQAYCGGSGDCETVANSPYSEIGGIPIAYLGIGMYLVLILLIYMESRGRFWRVNAPLMIFGISLAGTIYSAYLTYLEIAVIRAICPYCVVSAIALLSLLIISIFRLVSETPEAYPQKS